MDILLGDHLDDFWLGIYDGFLMKLFYEGLFLDCFDGFHFTFQRLLSLRISVAHEFCGDFLLGSLGGVSHGGFRWICLYQK